MDREMLRRRARVLRDLTTLVFLALALPLALMLYLAVAPAAAQIASGRQLLDQLPLVFYVAAIWMVRRSFAALARGAWFDEVVPRLLNRVGLCLFVGGLTRVFFAPWLARLLFPGPRGPVAHWDPDAITLGAVGLMLVVVARLLAQAAAMRAELDEIV